MNRRLLVLATTHRVAPGLLSWRAWQELRAGRVFVGSAEHPQLPHLAEAGLGYEVIEAADASTRARDLLEHARRQPTVWLAGPGGDEELMRAIAQVLVDLAEPPEVEVLHGSYDLPGARLLDLVAVMDRLRRECPWDAKQTHASLAPHLLEEAYEAVEAIETGDLASLRDELGDVLLQVAFHARMAEERADETRFSIDDVAAGIVDKLVRRHPHVFADVEVSGADEVKVNWDKIKSAERAASNGGQTSLLDGVPWSQPALALASALQRRALRGGLPTEVLEDVGTGLGAELFSLVRRACEAGLDPEGELRAALRQFHARVREWESS